MKLTVLGCGTSTGVPRLGNDWGSCDPANPKNRRSRVSIALENDAGSRILIDTSTDLRQQLLDNEIERLDAVFWTHDHADHCHGIDDLRALRFARGGPIPGYASRMTAERLRRRFDYVFDGQHGYPTIVRLETLDKLRIAAGFGVESCQMTHGPTESTAFRFEADGKAIMYAVDFSEISDTMVDLANDADVLVCDCLRRQKHPTHANLSMALDLAKRSKARITVLTHLDSSMDYAAVSAETPKNVLVGHDGMEIAL